MYLSTT